MEDDACTPFRAVLGRCHREAAAAFGHPLPGLFFAGLERSHLDPFGDDESRVEADAELADEAQISLFRLGPFEKGLRARPRDRAEIVDELLPAHADACVGHTDGLVVLVSR